MTSRTSFSWSKTTTLRLCETAKEWLAEPRQPLAFLTNPLYAKDSYLFEQFGCNLLQIDTPVAPNMAATIDIHSVFQAVAFEKLL